MRLFTCYGVIVVLVANLFIYLVAGEGYGIWTLIVLSLFSVIGLAIVARANRPGYLKEEFGDTQTGLNFTRKP
jgi:hypothetical protein